MPLLYNLYCALTCALCQRSAVIHRIMLSGMPRDYVRIILVEVVVTVAECWNDLPAAIGDGFATTSTINIHVLNT